MTEAIQKPLLRALASERLEIPPIWLMRQAGRYLPEYRRVRQQAGSFLDLCFNPELAAEVTLQPIQRYALDAAIVFADILLVPHGLGQHVWFEEGEGPRLEPVTNMAELRVLNASKVVGRVAPVFETLRRVKAALPGKVALIGFAGAPWTVTTYMIAGRGTPDQAPAKSAARQNPQFMAALIDQLVELTILYLEAQIEAGAEVVQLFDTWAGGLDSDLLEDLVFKPTARIATALRDDHPEVPIIGFPRGIGLKLGEFAKATGVAAVNLSTGDDPAVIAASLPPGVVMQGGLDPLSLVAGGPELERQAMRLLRSARGRPFIFNLGHGILPTTPPEHVRQLVDLVRQGAR